MDARTFFLGTRRSSVIDWSVDVAYWFTSGPRIVARSYGYNTYPRPAARHGAGDAGNTDAHHDTDAAANARTGSDEYADGVLPSHLIYTAAGWNGVYSDYADTDPDPQPSGDGEASITGLRADTARGSGRAVPVEDV